MSRPTASTKRPVEQYDHMGQKRANNPPVGLVDARSDAVEGKQTYAYDPHLDPTLIWAGKAERASFEVPTVSLHVHKRIDPRAIIEAMRKKNGSNFEQLSHFGSKAENPPFREAIEFYRHAHNWSSRLVAGDRLLAMNSLLEKEGLAGEEEGWAKLAKNLKAEIDATAMEAYRGTISLPFTPGKHGRVAVKIVDDRGIESLKIMEIL